MHDSRSNCISALLAMIIPGRLLSSSSSFPHKTLQVSRGGHGFLRVTCWPWISARFATLKPHALRFNSGQEEKHTVGLVCHGGAGLWAMPASLGTSVVREEQF